MARGGAHLQPKNSEGKPRPDAPRETPAAAPERPSRPDADFSYWSDFGLWPDSGAPVEPQPAPEPRARRSAAPAPPPRRAAKPEAPAPQSASRRSPPPPGGGHKGGNNGGGRRRRRSRGGVPLWPFVALLVAVMLFAGYKLVDTIVSYSRDRSRYDALQNMAVVRLTPSPAYQDEGQDASAEPAEVVPVSEVPISVDWDYLAETNPDVIAWLYGPDTVINYPVVQTVDNETYLTRAFDGSTSAAGTLFADYDSTLGIAASHFIVYGHNMKDDSMFGTLKGYSDTAYYQQHPILYLLTLGQNYRIDLLESQTIEALDTNYPTYFSNAAARSDYLGRLTSSAYWVNYDVADSEYQLITLSTCVSSDDHRLIVQGVLTPVE